MRQVVDVLTARERTTSTSDDAAAVMRLAHDERHVRRRVMEAVDGQKALVDLPDPIMLQQGDRLVLDDGTHIRVEAAEEPLYDIRAKDPVHLAELAWHIGNRHLAAEIRKDRILILQDHVIRTMLENLGATVSETRASFEPVRGAYSGHAAHNGHDQDHRTDHG